MSRESPSPRWKDWLWRRGDMASRGAVGREAAVTWFERIHVVSAIGLAVMLVGILAVGDGSIERRLAGVATALALAGTVWFCFFSQADWFFARRWTLYAYLVVGLPLFVGMGVVQPPLQLFLFLAYWQIFSLLPLVWAVLASIALTLGQSWAAQGFGWQAPITSGSGWALAIGVTAISALMAGFITSIISQSQQRQRLLDDLNATREQLATSERHAGVMQERQRLAGDLHDTIAQDLTSILMHLETAGTRLTSDHAAAASIAAARDAARQGLGEARRMVHALLPDVLGETTLVTAMATHVARWSRESGVAATFTAYGDSVSLPRDLEVTMFRALQESLANVRRHAHATNAAITLSNLDDEVILDVRDDGAGFQPESPVGGVGLQTMRHRVQQWNGTVTIEAEPEEGAVISIAIPIPIPASQEPTP